jgi:hypothetical protein
MNCCTPLLLDLGLMVHYFFPEWRESRKLMVLKVFLVAKNTDDP